MFGKKHAAESGKKKYLYMFEEGNKDMRELLGGKGANLAEMTNAGMPVPPGFTITTEACTQYYADGRQINEDNMSDSFLYRRWKAPCWFPSVPAPVPPCPA